MHPWLNWIEHLTTDEEVTGSNPVGCTNENPLYGGFLLIQTKSSLNKIEKNSIKYPIEKNQGGCKKDYI